MRNPLRIKPFLRRLDIPELIKGMHQAESEASIEKMTDKAVTLVNSKDFVNYWEDHPDLRFTQLMFNLNCDFFDHVYNMEDKEVLQKCGWVERKSTLFEYEGDMKFIDEFDSDTLLSILQEYGLSKKDHPESIIALVIEELEERQD